MIPVAFACLFLLCTTREATPEARSAVLLPLADWCRLARYGVEAMAIAAVLLAVHADILGALVARTGVRG
ncbi:hypothetical protein [Nonomuraea sp. NPDC052265]|uniref:hypothetical protein n=1 Tax=Nonomuraea sp. NPDC052265 TaxID=3364374 RepID=UPI0037C62F9C